MVGQAGGSGMEMGGHRECREEGWRLVGLETKQEMLRRCGGARDAWGSDTEVE